VFTADWNVTVGVALGVLVMAWIGWEARRAAVAAKAGPRSAPIGASVSRARMLVGGLPRLADCNQDRGVGWREDARVVVVTGTGGAGKTQAAAAYAHERWHGGTVDVLIWITAGDRAAIVAGYARAAEAAGLSGSHDGDEAALRLLAWLAQTDRTWLVVLDDLANPGDLTGLWPPRTSTGQVVLTTRRRDAALRRDAYVIEVGPFSAAEAATYLRAKFAGSPERLVEAAELAEDLGRLPLAIAQAAAYIVDRDIDCAAYRTRFADRSRTLADLGPEPGALPDDQRLPVAAAWSLSFQLADELAPDGQAARLLAVLAVLDPNGIPMDALLSAAIGGYVAGADVRDVVMHLRRLSLLDTSADGNLIRIHALTQRAVREHAGTSELDAAAVAAADGLVEVWPEEYTGDAERRMLLYTNTVALRATAESALWRHGAHPVILRSIAVLSDVGLRDAAGAHLRDTLSVAVTHLGADHADTLTVRHRLAGWLGQSDPARAVAEHEPVLADRVRVLGPDHTDTLMTRNNMLFWLGTAGDIEGAAAGFEALARDCARALGPTHESTLFVRNNLAFWLGEAGRTKEALQTATAIVDDSIRVFGAQARATLRHRHALAIAKGVAGRAADGAADLDALVPACQRVFGFNHLTTLIIRQHRAHWRGKAGDPVDALRQCRELLADRLRILGALHPDTLASRRELARWEVATGNPTAAQHILEALLQDQRRVLSAGHPELAATHGELAHLRETGSAM
jgi:hypothetical protein